MRFSCPTQVLFGPEALDTLAPREKCLLVLVSRSLPQEWENRLRTALERAECFVHLARRGGNEPDTDAIDAFVAGLPGGLEAVVAIGGGSTLDFAKAVAALVANGGAMAQWEFGPPPVAALPLYLIPSTCGSGSEVTPYAVVNNAVTARKFTVTAPCLRPKQALVIPSLLGTLPLFQVGATALDAFLHCLEAALGRPRNRLIEPLAASGLGLVWRYLPAAIIGQEPCVWTDPLALASLYGGLCISQSRTGLIHTLSVALAPYSDLPHGLLNAWLTPRALAFNADYYETRLAELATVALGQPFATDQDAIQTITAWIEGILPPGTGGKALTRPFEPTAVTARVLQDAGLSKVNNRPLPDGAVAKLVAEIAQHAAL
jgi:alcohol dehydrogenase class IV